MEAVDRGVLPGSAVYFHTHSALAREVFFYPLCTGHFYCDGTYEVNRSSYDSFLLIYVVAGSGVVCQQGREAPLPAGSFTLVDCYQPHFYATRAGWEIYWLHFDGILARRYFELCTRNGGIFAPDSAQTCAHQLRRVFSAFSERTPPNEADLSRRITDLLTELMLCSPEGKAGGSGGIVEETLGYIAEHVEEELTLEALARRASLSPFYFSRLFKRETGFPPHEYLIRARIDKARYLLKNTDLTVKEIAFCTGFRSECSFCTTFKKRCGSTPTEYRNEIAGEARMGRGETAANNQQGKQG